MPAKRPREHGTARGYNQHKYWIEPVCGPCAKAKADQMVNYRADGTYKQRRLSRIARPAGTGKARLIADTGGTVRRLRKDDSYSTAYGTNRMRQSEGDAA
jgi:hypothetical protein